MAEYKGIDVSENNGKLDWAKIKAAGIQFAIVRTGYGRYHTDTQYVNNIAGVKAQGLPYGVYHYSYALNASSAKEEAAFVIQLVKAQSLDLSWPIWLDMEDDDRYKVNHGMTINKTNITSICKAFVEAVRSAGYKVGIYASKSWLEDYIDTAQMGDCSYWLAQWSSKPTWKGSYDIWQHSGSGSVSGVSGTFDLDVAYSLGAARTVTAMQQDKTCAAGVTRYAGTQTALYKDAQLTTELATLAKGEAVKYYGNHCYVDDAKYAYVAATAGSGYVKASDLRTSKP